MDIPNEALSRYPKDYKTIGGSAMERRAFTAGAEWVRREMEARVVELEAVIRAVDDWFNDLGSQHVPNGNALAGLLEAAPPEVLADHDAAVWDEGAEDGAWNYEHADMIERGNRKPITNPYRVGPPSASAFPAPPSFSRKREEFAARWEALVAEGLEEGYLEHDHCYNCGGELAVTTDTYTVESRPNPDFDPGKPNPYAQDTTEGDTVSVTMPARARNVIITRGDFR